MKIELEGPL